MTRQGAWLLSWGVLATLGGLVLLGLAGFHALESDYQDHDGVLLFRVAWPVLLLGVVGLMAGIVRWGTSPAGQPLEQGDDERSHSHEG